MSDLHMELATAIEKKMCEELCMEPCERTYEIACEILEEVARVNAEQLKF